MTLVIHDTRIIGLTVGICTARIVSGRRNSDAYHYLLRGIVPFDFLERFAWLS